MSSDSELLLNRLTSLVEPEMGYQLQFYGHEDGGELEPFVWQQPTQPSPLELIRSQGWLKQLDTTKILDAWLAPEQSGTVNGETWLAPEADEAQLLLSAAAQSQRQKTYQNLLQLLQTLQNLQAFQLDCGTDYKLAVLLGQAADGWICLSPTVPHATPLNDDSPVQMVIDQNRIDQNQAGQDQTSRQHQTSKGKSNANHQQQLEDEQQPINAKNDAKDNAKDDAKDNPKPDDTETPVALESLTCQIQTLLDQLGTIQLYGYYGGGYNQTHEYYFIQATGETADQALQAALLQASLIEIGSLTALQPTNRDNAFDQLNQSLQSLSNLQVYRFSFWNDEHFYMIGQDSSGNWGGLIFHSHFTYNP